MFCVFCHRLRKVLKMSDFEENDFDLSSSSSSSSNASDDEDVIFENIPRRKNENYLVETVPQYTAEVFIEHFRIGRNICEEVSEQFKNSRYFHRHHGQYGKISAYHQLLIFLWYAAHQTSSFRDVADRFNITIRSLYRIIRRLTYFLSNMAPTVITWPTDQEKQEIEQFFRHKGFPGVVGVIDGTHVKLDKPSIDPDSYINRKGYYSIQLQVVCDHRMKIRDMFTGFPGSVHDSRVLRRSPLYATLEEKCHDLYILGDSGYPLLPNLLTPFRDRGQLTRQQINYNNKLSKSRYIIEHCFGRLKQKFRELYHLKLRSIWDTVHFIRACCVLHNLSVDDVFYEDQLNDEFDVAINVDDNDESDEEDDRNAIQIRNNVVNMLWQR